ncbi:MAG: cytochrome c3 family protein [Acidobacteria bacterium]|nr:cytochrome c3 family protein [Acidobacteriota bacterium]
MASFSLLLLLVLAADPITQPLPYSHKLHLSKGLDCKTCHTNADPGESMGIPKVSTCLACHRAIKTDSPHIQELAKAGAEKREIKWKRVYQIPSYVFFSHRIHTEAGASCQNCHGDVPQREVLAKEGDISMGGCMTCHQQKRAPNDCNTCHEPR